MLGTPPFAHQEQRLVFKHRPSYWKSNVCPNLGILI